MSKKKQTNGTNGATVHPIKGSSSTAADPASGLAAGTFVLAPGDQVNVRAEFATANGAKAHVGELALQIRQLELQRDAQLDLAINATQRAHSRIADIVKMHTGIDSALLRCHLDVVNMSVTYAPAGTQMVAETQAPATPTAPAN